MISASHVAESLRDSEQPQLGCGVCLGEADLRCGVRATRLANQDEVLITVTNLEQEPPVSYRPELPDWGAYLRWPTNSDDWIHEDDLEVVRQLLPGPRVFKRTQWDGQFYHLQYGAISFRVRPSLWVRVPNVDLEVGQQVELLSDHGRNDAGIYRIAEILFVPSRSAIEYTLHGISLQLDRHFDRLDLQPLHTPHTLHPSDFFHHTIETTDADF